MTGQFTATGTFADGSTADITRFVTWASATPSVATISDTGLATALAPGTSAITASLAGVTSPADTLTVIAPSYVVNTTADDFGFTNGTTSLREAITFANAIPGQTITFDATVFASAQTITLSRGQLELSNTSGTETITGPAAGVTVSGGGASRVFQVDKGVTASISGLTITDGNAGNFAGGGVLNYGTITLTNCTIAGNAAYQRRRRVQPFRHAQSDRLHRQRQLHQPRFQRRWQRRRCCDRGARRSEKRHDHADRLHGQQQLRPEHWRRRVQ